MKEYVTVLFREKSVMVKRIATYHPSKPEGPVVVEFAVHVGPRIAAKTRSLADAMAAAHASLPDA